MTALDISDIRLLLGGWSVFALMCGLAGAVLNYIGVRLDKSEGQEEEAGVFRRRLPWLMGLLSAFIGLCVEPLSYAYSGPIPPAVRELPRFDMRFASLIAFTFGFAFALDLLRAKRFRSRPGNWLCVGLYSFVAVMLIGSYLNRRSKDALSVPTLTAFLPQTPYFVVKQS